MLARPEAGTREHILLWLAGKDPEEKFNWHYYDMCACGQYAREEMGLSNLAWITLAGTKKDERPLAELNRMAFFCENFGELYEFACGSWSH